LLEPGDQAPIAGDHAVDYLIRVVRESPGQIHLLAVGPLTNVALAMRRDPSFARNLAHLTIMGGAVRGGDRLDLPLAEHNIVCDPEAAHIVFSGGARMTVVPLDVTTRVAIRAGGVERLRSTGGAFQAAVADQVVRYPRYAQTGATYLHDPLAAAAIVQPDLLATTDLRLEVETQGRLTTAMTLARRATADAPANAAVALEVDVAAAESFIVDRIVAAPTI
jgi:purine nucleosidase